MPQKHQDTFQLYPDSVGYNIELSINGKKFQMFPLTIEGMEKMIAFVAAFRRLRKLMPNVDEAFVARGAYSIILEEDI